MSKPGESFEAQIALMLHSADFVIKEQPHKIMHKGKQIGDLDVLAQEPSSGEIIGVSCKDWHGQVPGSEQFSHLVEMLEFENLKYGIFASSGDIANTLPLRAEHVRNTKGINIVLLDHDEIARLKKFAYSKQTTDIEDYFKTRLGLITSKKRTIADEMRAQKDVAIGRTVGCERLLPVNFWNESPRYIMNNHDLVPSDSTLKLEPYLVINYRLYVQARHQNAGKPKESNDAGTVIVDAVRGTIVPENDPVFKHLIKYYANAEMHTAVQEKGFRIKKAESFVNQREVIRVVREQIAAQNEIRTHYTTAKNGQRQKIVRPRSDDVRIIGSYLIYVPVWDVKFNLGDKTYQRIYFGYDDDDVILDEMSKCQIKSCEYNTNSICLTCHSTMCDKHNRPCSACSDILCEICAHVCIDCRKNFCDKHNPQTVCGICRATLCKNCSIVLCTECKTVMCSNHREKCSRCNDYVCMSHIVSKKYILVAKNFCSQLCLNRFDEGYRSSGVFGRLKKILKK
ncbi:restriction endonuclease [Candidatus Nitrosotenuis chungbukensis]|uniref:restriction endonuclease n=1 Tax=Candidatus Nitrosotenuis chungbukensis TaxID=1353246 RepID=UPI0005B28A5A|nr:restriction endonuclease [Candidatus Nitrosotenuis chungbukensis]WKT58764.1 restriction endonuclease [Candidatus Nitrosotenuis chungbukensis]